MNVKATPRKSSRPAKKKGRSDDFDAHIGQILKSLRLLRGISQEQLANAMNITFQQVQKYESGVNRISATSLYKISKVLEVDITDFYDGYEKQEETMSLIQEIEKDKELALFVRNWQLIKNKDLKKRMIKLMGSIIEAEEK